MGTTYSVKLSDSLSEVEILKVKEAIDSTLFAVNQIFSTYIENSEISKINKNKISIISDEFKFKKSLEYFEMSNGTFDITVHPLVKLWGFGNEASIKSPPSKDKIINLLSKIGMNKVQLNNYNLVKDLEIELDMSAIAKGYGVDRIAEYLLNNSFTNFMVEIGGEVRCEGKKSSNKNWTIGIQNPQEGNLQNKLVLSNTSIATSGSYNNYFEFEGRIYSHTINPKTGYPVEHSLVSATIIAPHCIDADALATTVMVLGVEKGLALIESLDNMECYLIEASINDTLIEYKSKGFSEYEI